jgi:predicted KAP-like P-loop ATPase
MSKIIQTYPNSRIIVFIDDLDRCSPKTVLEVFESIKVFLGIKGFVYVIGLSHETIAKLITIEYEKSGVKGEQYIRKIIQIPIIIPDWNNKDVQELINRVSNNNQIDVKYSSIISDNIDLITKAVEFNPRRSNALSIILLLHMKFILTILKSKLSLKSFWQFKL